MSRLTTSPARIGTSSPRVAPSPKVAEQVYLTPEHRAWSAFVIRRAGGRCQWLGCTKAAPRHRMVADHIVEIKDGGAALDSANGQCLCVAHNTLKAARARAGRMKA